jgi:NCS1 family nucleobase:cation symporter-1
VSTVIGLGLVTSTASGFSWVGYFLGLFGGKTGAIGSSSIGILISFVLSCLLYAGLMTMRTRRAPAAARPGVPEASSMAHE